MVVIIVKINNLNIKKIINKHEELIIAIDGPSGVGKSTIAREISQKYNLLFINSGSLYRNIAYYIDNMNINIDNVSNILNFDIFSYDKRNNEIVFLIKKNEIPKFMLCSIKNTIYTENISNNIEIRLFVKKFIKNIIDKDKKIIMEGRDITSNILKNEANIKIYLCADFITRVNRRYNQLLNEKNKVTINEVMKNMMYRDYKDLNKKNGKLQLTDDSIIINTTNLSINEVIFYIEQIINYNGFDIHNKINISYELSKLNSLKNIWKND